MLQEKNHIFYDKKVIIKEKSALNHLKISLKMLFILVNNNSLWFHTITIFNQVNVGFANEPSELSTLWSQN